MSDTFDEAGGHGWWLAGGHGQPPDSAISSARAAIDASSLPAAARATEAEPPATKESQHEDNEASPPVRATDESSEHPHASQSNQSGEQ